MRQIYKSNQYKKSENKHQETSDKIMYLFIQLFERLPDSEYNKSIVMFKNIEYLYLIQLNIGNTIPI